MMRNVKPPRYDDHVLLFTKLFPDPILEMDNVLSLCYYAVVFNIVNLVLVF